MLRLLGTRDSRRPHRRFLELIMGNLKTYLKSYAVFLAMLYVTTKFVKPTAVANKIPVLSDL
jgi:hypothetical protein